MTIPERMDALEARMKALEQVQRTTSKIITRIEDSLVAEDDSIPCIDTMETGKDERVRRLEKELGAMTAERDALKVKLASIEKLASESFKGLDSMLGMLGL